MKVVLIRSNEREMARYNMRETNVAGAFPPLGLAHLAAFIRGAGHDVSILDAHVENIPVSELLKFLPTDSPVFGFTSTSKLWPVVAESIRAVKKAFPGKLVVVGGPQITAYPGESMQSAPADIGVIGEGEEALAEIISRYNSNEDYSYVPQTVVMKNNKEVINPPFPRSLDLDQLPAPALDLLPLEKYRCVTAQKPFITMVTTRGCPYRCAFCSQSYFREKVRMESAETVVSRIEDYYLRYRVKEIVIFDDVFTLNRSRVMKICDLIEGAGIKLKLDIRARVDNVDGELLKRLSAAGCHRIHFGIESGTQRILDLMQKDITIAQITEAVKAAKAAGMEVRGYFILGYPGETIEEIEATLAFSRRLPLDWASFTLATPNPRTKLLQDALQTGLLEFDFYREYTLGRATGPPPFFPPTGRSLRALKRLKNRGYIRFYLQRRVIRHVLPWLFQSQTRHSIREGLLAGFREIGAFNRS